jgi:hypothetical protein
MLAFVEVPFIVRQVPVEEGARLPTLPREFFLSDIPPREKIFFSCYQSFTLSCLILKG